MQHDIKSVLLRQHDMAWRFAELHLDALTMEDCLWRPGGDMGLHVWRDESSGSWRADWPQSEAYEIGPASLGWITWHMLFWWRMVLDQSFGEGQLTRSDIAWPGTADGVRSEAKAVEARWRAAIKTLGEDELLSPALTRWPFKDRPFADVVAWANLELMKSASEMGYVLFLRQGQRR
ncbi:DinB family protein [Henriciella marina]|uniref:DinB family protein n=1 Tax=Henriciella marina TaxID=453851 RepID=UPI00039A387F|nr:DinB family protein [Henriciella marina]